MERQIKNAFEVDIGEFVPVTAESVIMEAVIDPKDGRLLVYSPAVEQPVIFERHGDVKEVPLNGTKIHVQPSSSVST